MKTDEDLRAGKFGNGHHLDEAHDRPQLLQGPFRVYGRCHTCHL